MIKKCYCKPNSKAIDVVVSEIIASSGDAGGTVNPMPWGSNGKHEVDFPWENVENDEDEF